MNNTRISDGTQLSKINDTGQLLSSFDSSDLQVKSTSIKDNTFFILYENGLLVSDHETKGASHKYMDVENAFDYGFVKSKFHTFVYVCTQGNLIIYKYNGVNFVLACSLTLPSMTESTIGIVKEIHGEFYTIIGESFEFDETGDRDDAVFTYSYNGLTYEVKDTRIYKSNNIVDSTNDVTNTSLLRPIIFPRDGELDRVFNVLNFSIDDDSHDRMEVLTDLTIPSGPFRNKGAIVSVINYDPAGVKVPTFIARFHNIGYVGRFITVDKANGIASNSISFGKMQPDGDRHIMTESHLDTLIAGPEGCNIDDLSVEILCQKNGRVIVSSIDTSPGKYIHIMTIYKNEKTHHEIPQVRARGLDIHTKHKLTSVNDSGIIAIASGRHDNPYVYITSDYGKTYSIIYGVPGLPSVHRSPVTVLMANDGNLYIGYDDGSVCKSEYPGNFDSFINITERSSHTVNQSMDYHRSISNIIEYNDKVFFIYGGRHEEDGITVNNSGLYVYHCSKNYLEQLFSFDTYYQINQPHLSITNGKVFIGETNGRVRVFDVENNVWDNDMSPEDTFDIVPGKGKIQPYQFLGNGFNYVSGNFCSDGMYGFELTTHGMKDADRITKVPDSPNVLDSIREMIFIPSGNAQTSEMLYFNNTYYTATIYDERMIGLHISDGSSTRTRVSYIPLNELLTSKVDIILARFGDDLLITYSGADLRYTSIWKFNAVDDSLTPINLAFVNKDIVTVINDVEVLQNGEIRMITSGVSGESVVTIRDDNSITYRSVTPNKLITSNTSPINLQMSNRFISGNDSVSDFGEFNVNKNNGTGVRFSPYTFSNKGIKCDKYYDRLSGEPIDFDELITPPVGHDIELHSPRLITPDDSLVYITSDGSSYYYNVQYHSNKHDMITIDITTILSADGRDTYNMSNLINNFKYSLVGTINGSIVAILDDSIVFIGITNTFLLEMSRVREIDSGNTLANIDLLSMTNSVHVIDESTNYPLIYIEGSKNVWSLNPDDYKEVTIFGHIGGSVNIDHLVSQRPVDPDITINTIIHAGGINIDNKFASGGGISNKLELDAFHGGTENSDKAFRYMATPLYTPNELRNVNNSVISISDGYVNINIRDIFTYDTPILNPIELGSFIDIGDIQNWVGYIYLEIDPDYGDMRGDMVDKNDLRRMLQIVERDVHDSENRIVAYDIANTISNERGLFVCKFNKNSGNLSLMFNPGYSMSVSKSLNFRFKIKIIEAMALTPDLHQQNRRINMVDNTLITKGIISGASGISMNCYLDPELSVKYIDNDPIVLLDTSLYRVELFSDGIDNFSFRIVDSIGAVLHMSDVGLDGLLELVISHGTDVAPTEGDNKLIFSLVHGNGKITADVLEIPGIYNRSSIIAILTNFNGYVDGCIKHVSGDNVLIVNSTLRSYEKIHGNELLPSEIAEVVGWYMDYNDGCVDFVLSPKTGGAFHDTGLHSYRFDGHEFTYNGRFPKVPLCERLSNDIKFGGIGYANNKAFEIINVKGVNVFTRHHDTENVEYVTYPLSFVERNDLGERVAIKGSDTRTNVIISTNDIKK